jgi:hypothetical protein
VSRPGLAGRALLAAVALAASAVATATSPPATARTVLTVAMPFTTTTREGHVGTTYNVGVQMRVRGPDAVELVSARARRLTTGLEQPEPVAAWGCDGKEWFGGAVGADLRGRRNTDIRPFRGLRVRERDEDCLYFLFRFVPSARGTFEAREGVITYRVNGTTITQEFAFTFTVDVRHEGPDPREWS